jgi:hypothetical protein
MYLSGELRSPWVMVPPDRKKKKKKYLCKRYPNEEAKIEGQQLIGLNIDARADEKKIHTK